MLTRDTPQGPGFFIFFQTSTGGPGDDGGKGALPDIQKKDEQDILGIMTLIGMTGVLSEP